MKIKEFKLNKERKLIVIMGGIFLIIAVIYRLFPYLNEVLNSNGEIIDRQIKINRYQAVAEQRDYWENRLNHLNRVVERAESTLINGATQSLAAVSLQNIINEILSRSGVEVITIRVLKTEKLEGDEYIKVPVEFMFESSIRQLKDILYRLESWPKLLTVSDLKSKNTGKKDDTTIKTTITIFGLMKTSDNDNA